MSQNSGLDEAGLENLGKGKSATTSNSNKSGLELVNQATGIPKFNSQIHGKKSDGAKENLRKISPLARQSMGSTVSPAITLGKGIEGSEIPIPNQKPNINKRIN